MKKQTNLSAAGRKLSLNKKTISNLTAAEMITQVGGDKTKGCTHKQTCGFDVTCYTCGRCTYTRVPCF